MKKLNLVLATTFLISSSANAVLVSRLGGLAYYDTEANLTWLADANYAATSYINSYGASGSAYGDMNWDDANNWAAGLEIAGVSGWRLPTTVDAGNDGATYSNIYQGVDFGYNITAASELSNMYYNVLGNTAYDINGSLTGCSASDNCITKTGSFINLQGPGRYWSSTEYVLNAEQAWNFYMYDGNQSFIVKSNMIYAWAVQSGDVSAVPVPAAIWLFGTGLIGLFAFFRRTG